MQGVLKEHEWMPWMFTVVHQFWDIPGIQEKYIKYPLSNYHIYYNNFY